jgi:N-acetylmuramoyl-L-alanine amidase
MSIICLDAGHGGKKPGAEYRGLIEKDVNLKVTLRTGEILGAYGYEIIYTRKDDSHKELTERCDIANLARCDVFISIHCNATNNFAETAKGEEIWIYEGSKESKKLAECLADEVDAFFPDEPFRGIKETKGLVVLHYTKMPAALIELGFIDRSSTNASFQDEATLEKISQLIATGVNEYLNS